MNHSHSLRQLLKVRQIEEEESRTALEIVLGELNRLERAIAAARKRVSRGRALVKASINPGVENSEVMKARGQFSLHGISEQAISRLAAQEDANAASRLAESLQSRLNAVRARVERIRAEFLAHRVERRQVETLILEENTRRQNEAERRAQQAIDDWYGGKLNRAKQAAARTGLLKLENPVTKSRCER